MSISLFNQFHFIGMDSMLFLSDSSHANQDSRRRRRCRRRRRSIGPWNKSLIL